MHFRQIARWHRNREIEYMNWQAVQETDWDVPLQGHCHVPPCSRKVSTQCGYHLDSSHNSYLLYRLSVGIVWRNGDCRQNCSERVGIFHHDVR